MGEIRRLSEKTIKLIAAGEVIQAPFSVVKELVENSLDAGADRIEVTLKEGGKREIEVRDNGEGMDREDALLAWERYTTSKVRDEDDLKRVSTLGFRGEALPSIAQVSLVTLLTSTGEGGTELVLKGGEIISVEERSLPRGTLIRVEELFFNTPVRRKALRTSSRELRDILEVVTAYSLSFPSVHFRVREGSKEVFFTPPRQDIRERIGDIWGEVRDVLLPVRVEEGEILLEGWVSPPGMGRGYPVNFFFVNGRWIRGRNFRKAIMDAYSSYLREGTYPLTFLFLKIPPHQIDVNIHPSKEEIKFREEGKIWDMVRRGIGESLPRVRERVVSYPSFPIRESQKTLEFSRVKEAGRRYVKEREISQVKRTYLLQETEKGILILDQHALHERLVYERWKKEMEKGPPPNKKLLFPVTLEVSPWEESLLEENRELLESFGFYLEPFGSRTYILRSLPVFLDTSQPLVIISEILQELEKGKKEGVGGKRERLLKCLSCRSSIKAGDVLSSKEIDSLLSLWEKEKKVVTCPHGRPVFILLTWEEIEKRFQRR